jgi:ATP phosphoribosyltransferase
MITLALSKGRIFDETLPLLKAAGIEVLEDPEKSRKLILPTKGVHVDMIKLYGSMELAPLTGLADAIVDLVSTGNTLKANHLVEVERIMDISARLVVNQAALKLKQAPIRAIIDAFAGAVKKD